MTITIKPKARQTNKSVIIKSQERNVGGMYVARYSFYFKFSLYIFHNPINRASFLEFLNYTCKCLCNAIDLNLKSIIIPSHST